MRLHVSFKCWLLGHEDFVRCAPGRLYLECIECGRETKGWRIGTSGRSGDEGVGERVCGAPSVIAVVLRSRRQPPGSATGNRTTALSRA